MTNLKTTQVSFTISNIMLDKLDELMEDEGVYLSRSDVIRAAVAEFYDAHRPKYIYEKSPNQKVKRKEQLEEKNWEKMTDEEYALSLNAVILNNRENIPFAAFVTFGKRTIAIRLDGLKKWKGTEQFDINMEEHLRLITEDPEILTKQLATEWSVKEFDREYNIDLNNQ